MTKQRAAQIIGRPLPALYDLATSIGFWDECGGELPDVAIYPYIVWTRNGKTLKGMAYNLAHARMLAGRDDYRIVDRTTGQYTKSI